ncbi:cytochrome P450 [Calothrix sp. HK-06]|nr:cytochrome P450 [Calothrix sp. HK-06]
MNVPYDFATPALIQKIQWIRNPFAMLEKYQKKYGDLFALPIGDNFETIVYVSHPDAVKQILKFDIPDKIDKAFQVFFGNYSLFTLNGSAHHRQRQLLLPPFHGERMRAYGQTICKITEQVIKEWGLGKPFSAQFAMEKISMQIIMQNVFGIEDQERFQKLTHLLTIFMKISKHPLNSIAFYFPILQRNLGLLSPWRAFLRLRQQIDTLIYQEIQSRRKNFEQSRTDILAMLMQAQDEQGKTMTDVELRDELMTLLVAGYETTSTTITWALYWIHKLPEVKAKLLQELSSLDEDADSLELSRLPYLKAACNETLRIFPTITESMVRLAKFPCKLLDCYSIEPGTMLIASIHLLHRREDLYPEPTLFKPERFLQRQFSPYEFLPFGGGIRRCIGMAFAQFQMQLVIATILSRVELALVSNRPVKPVYDGAINSPSTVQLAVTKYRD